jgi:hypothetical protein
MRSVLLQAISLSVCFSSISMAMAAEPQAEAPDNTSYLITGFDCSGLNIPDGGHIFFADDKTSQEVVARLSKYDSCEKAFERFGVKKYAWLSVTDIEALALKLNSYEDFKSVELKIVPTDVKGQVVLHAIFVKKPDFQTSVSNVFSLYDRGQGRLNKFNVELLSRKLSPFSQWKFGVSADYAQTKTPIRTDLGEVEIRDLRDIHGKDQKSYLSVTPYFNVDAHLYKQISLSFNSALTFDNDGAFKRDLFNHKKDMAVSLNYRDRFLYGLLDIQLSPVLRLYDAQTTSTNRNDANVISANIDRAEITDRPESTDRVAVIDGQNFSIGDNISDVSLYGLKYAYTLGSDESVFKFSQSVEYYQGMKDKKKSMQSSIFSMRANVGRMVPLFDGFFAGFLGEDSSSKGIVLPTERFRGANPVRQNYSTSLGYRNRASSEEYVLTLGSEDVYSQVDGFSAVDSLSGKSYQSASSYVQRSNRDEAARSQSEFIGIQYISRSETLNLNLGARYFLKRMF